MNLKSKEDKVDNAVQLVCRICDLFTNLNLEGASDALVQVYEAREIEDSWNRIKQLGKPEKCSYNLNSWQLEKLAMNELDGGSEIDDFEQDVQAASQEIKAIAESILEYGEDAERRRQDNVEKMELQQSAILKELDKAKEFLAHMHEKHFNDKEIAQLPVPAPIEQRIRAFVAE